MGMQQKLERAYKEGFEAGKKQTTQSAIELAEIRGAVKGATETWNLVEEMIPNLKGIGPKTQQKILWSIQEYSRQERAKLNIK